MALALVVATSFACGQDTDSSHTDRLDPTSAAARWEELRATYLRDAERPAKPQTVFARKPLPRQPAAFRSPAVEWTPIDETSTLDAALSVEQIAEIVADIPDFKVPVAMPAEAAGPTVTLDDVVELTAAPEPVSKDSKTDDTAFDAEPVTTPTITHFALEPTAESPSELAVQNTADPFVGFVQLDLPDVPATVDMPVQKKIDIRDRLQLKPLAAITPSKSYTAGEDTCEFTCPTPAGCEADVRCPDDIPLPADGGTERVHAETLYHWAASNVHYSPLYFEDARLERYGHHIFEPAQSLKSVALFTAHFATLPYQMTLDPPHSDVSPLGFYRPGEAAPCLKRALPWNTRAAAYAAGTYTGLIFLVP